MPRLSQSNGEANINFYKRHIGDYIKDAGHLKLLEHGVYARLMDVYYTREAGIHDDKAARLIGASTRPELEALKTVLEEFFVLTDGIWIQKRCEEEIEVANSKAEKNRENGNKGGRPKKNKTDEEPKNNPSGFVSVNENNLSQTPDSRLQTPDIKAEAKAVGDSTCGDTEPAARRTAAPSTRLSADWSPNEDDIRFCETHRTDLRVDETAARFRDYWTAQPGTKGRKLDWSATWRNWVRNEKQQNRPNTTAYQSANDKAREWASGLTGRNRNERHDQPDIIDLNPAPRKLG